MTRPADILFEPFACKSMRLDNRIVMAPMTRSFAVGGTPDQRHVDYYRRRAEGGVGLILSEGTTVDRPAARNDPGVPFFHGPALDGWKDVIDGVHAAGGRMGPQVWHTASVYSPTAAYEPDAPVESPSGLQAPGSPRGIAMSEEDVADTIDAFARAAADAKRLGFDTIEVHGAHGYLVDQFFWPGTNARDDGWGGPAIADRARFGAALIAAIRAAVGPDFPVILRVSQWKQQDFAARIATTPDEMTAWLGPLVDAGVDILHCSQRRFWTPEFPELDGDDGLNFAGWAKKLTGAATISVGSVGLSSDFLRVFQGEATELTGIDALLDRMERGEFDLIAVGRALLTEPEWANKVRRGAMDELNGFDPSALAELV